MKTKIAILTIAAALLSGCAYQAIPDVNPAVSVYQSYGDKVPGRFALYVNADEMEDTIKPSGYACSSHSYPVDARSQFVTSAQQTLENILEEVEFVDAPLDRTVLTSDNYDGMVVVEVDSFEVELRAIPGFWTYDLDAESEVIIKVFIDDSDGRLFGATVEGDADDTREGGLFCDGGSEAVGESVNAAMKEGLRNMAERLANSTRLRTEAE
ncbi:MAG: hypothetical protein ACR2QC_05465 [Gammaproteobacteria bacterium]